ncbi:MAG TPA: hypothetical protein VLP30_05475, partial [Desulfatirhabdiaceae bacterium]|nr:hypothetical protein [Desulfatirhabdiaceae bacterium]
KIPVGIIIEYVSTRYSSDNDMIERSGFIYACFSWHGFLYKISPKLIFHVRSKYPILLVRGDETVV